MDSARRSLALTRAEDDTLRGALCVPAMLSMIKDLLGRHLTVITEIVDHPSEGSTLNSYGHS